MHVHRFWSSRCSVKHDTEEGRHNSEICRTRNSLERNLQFRAALAAAVSCVRAKGLPVVVVDTFPVTDTASAESESDGVHFEATTTAMEAGLPLQVAFNGLAAAPILPSDKCLPPEAFSLAPQRADHQRGRSSRGSAAAVAQPPRPLRFIAEDSYRNQVKKTQTHTRHRV
jgi:hypothetical protein